MPFHPSQSNSRWRHGVTLAGLFAVLLGSASPASLAQPSLIAQSISRSPKVITGKLTPNSTLLEDEGSYYEPHTFEGTAGETLILELTSEDFDAFLILQNPSGESISQDDDGAGETNARITVTLPVTGTYTLLVNSYAVEETGTYRLEIQTATAEDQALAQASQLNQQAIELYQAGRYAEAIPLAEQALAITEAALGPEHPSTATSLNNLAGLYRSQGRYAEAEPLLQQALAIYEAALGPEHPSTAISLNHLATLYRSQGRYAEAEPLYQQALAIREEALGPEHPSTATILNNLALLYQTQGRYAEAEPLYQQALAIREVALGPEHPSTASSLNNLATLYESQGRYAEAESLHRQALSIQQQALGADHPDIATSLNALAGVVRVQGRHSEAEPLYQQALEIRQQVLGLDHPSTAISLNDLATLYRHRGRYEEAETLYQQAVDIKAQTLGPDHPETAVSLNHLASLYRGQARYAEAEALYQQVLAIRLQAYGPDHPFTAVILNSMSKLYQAQDRFDLALSYLSRVLSIEETMLHRNLVGGSDADKQDYIATVTPTTYQAISFHLNDIIGDSAAAQLVFATVLQRKGRILDFFTNIRGQFGDDRDALSLFNELNAANTQLSTLTYAGAANLEQLTTLQNHIRDLEAALSRRSPEFAELATSPSIEDIQAVLPQGTALVEFVRYQTFASAAPSQEQWGDYRYAAYILQPNGTIQGIDLGPAAAIDAAVNTVSQSLASPKTPLGQVKAEARGVDALVMAPLRETLGDTTTVFISPDGALNLIPFEALMDESDRYLVETYQFRYLTSGRDLMRLDGAAEVSNPAVLVGNPTYGRPGELVAQADTRTIDVANGIFPALPGTQVEVDLIAPKLNDAQVYTQTNATEAVIKQHNSPSILHIATHGFFEPSEDALNPLLQSGLILAGAAAGGQSGPDQDGILTALEVTGMNLQDTQLVVLSACETGLGEVTTGEGIYGLRRAFVLAGSQTQVISLWKVSDSATQELMVDYYDRLLSGSPRDVALRETQLAFLRSDEYNHPYYWAAFIGSGDWRPLQQ